jgi:hypothetical protein
LHAVLDREQMTERVRVLLGHGGVTVQTATLIDVKPGQRALVAYRVTGAAGPSLLYAKAYADPARAAHVDGLLRRLSTEVFATTPSLCVADPMGFDGELGLVLFAPVRGRSLDAIAADTPALGYTAAWLATLHGSRLRLERTLDAAHEAANATAWAELVAERHPEVAGDVTRLAGELAARPPRDAGEASVPIHKDFHYEHVIVGDSAADTFGDSAGDTTRVGVVDLDEARMGDPAFDVGHFVAYLRLLALRTGMSGSDAARWEGAFLRGYGARAERVERARLRWFAAYSCVKLAKQLATGRGPRPRPEGAARTAQLTSMVREGSAWLTS